NPLKSSEVRAPVCRAFNIRSCGETLLIHSLLLTLICPARIEYYQRSGFTSYQSYSRLQTSAVLAAGSAGILACRERLLARIQLACKHACRQGCLRSQL